MPALPEHPCRANGQEREPPQGLQAAGLHGSLQSPSGAGTSGASWEHLAVPRPSPAGPGSPERLSPASLEKQASLQVPGLLQRSQQSRPSVPLGTLPQAPGAVEA